jgi:hypothetical protein
MPLPIGACRRAAERLGVLEQRHREANLDNRAVARRARHVEGAAADLRAFTHHRHPVVPFGTGGGGIEPPPVVTQTKDDVVILLAHRDPHIGRSGMLEGVHDALPADVVEQQRDRSGQLDVRDVEVEGDPCVTPHLVDEGLERLRETPRAERRTMQVADQRSDAIRRLLLGVLDLGKLPVELGKIPFVEKLLGDVNLQGETEQDLGEVVVEVARDLETFVRPLLRHRVGELP